MPLGQHLWLFGKWSETAKINSNFSFQSIKVYTNIKTSMAQMSMLPTHWEKTQAYKNSYDLFGTTKPHL